MCGIAGVIRTSGLELEVLGKMSAVLRHRGPDDEGFVAHEFNNPFLSFRGDDTVSALSSLPHWRSSSQSRHHVGMCGRRLSILDLSPAGHQPMVSADGNLALVFNGEIYNYVELAAELETLGWRLRPCGDTAVLLAAFAQWGPACVHRLRGMWAFAVYDRRAERLTLSRDRFGIKPLYFARCRDSFAFASEIKGVLAALPGDPRGSVYQVVRLLAWGGIDDDGATLFEDVHALPAGSNLHVSWPDLNYTVEEYYQSSAPADGGFQGTVEDAVHEYRQRLGESIRLHMRSDVQVGSCLSGGLDSSLAAAMAAPLTDDHLATFTAVYDDPAVDERRYVELHAARSGRFDTNFAAPTPEALLADLDRLVWAQDHPMTSSSPFAQWSVMQLAGSQKIKVLLDGQGADEAIGGYSYFAGAYLVDLARTGRPLRWLRAARLLRNRRGIHVWHELARAAYHELPLTLRIPVRRAARVGLQLVASRHRSIAGKPSQPVLRTFTDHCVHAVRHNLPELLRYEDRSSMAFSIESRVPFLDHPLVEFVLSLPPHLKIHDGWTKFVQRKASEGLVPPEIVWRRDKLGFATPQQAWKRTLVGPLRDFVNQADVPMFLDRPRLELLLSSDLSNNTLLSEFWQIVFLLKWMQVFRVKFTD
jgi:asparagine synthase (glutamine-hydrolysing)